MTPFNQKIDQIADKKMSCPQSIGSVHKKIVKLIPKPFNPILPKIEVKTEYNSTKILSADEKQK